MAGVTLISADSWIIVHFASTTSGAVSLMSYAKQLFTVPMAILAQAAARPRCRFSLVFGRRNAATNLQQAWRTRYRAMAALGLLAASGMITLGQPAIDLVFTGGRFTSSDARQCALYFAVFSVSLFLWSAQAIYCARVLRRRKHVCAHGRWNGGDGGFVSHLLCALPLARAMGLAIASNIGIALQTGTIAVLLHKRRMVSLASLDYAEMGRCLLAALTSGAGVWIVIWGIGGLLNHLSSSHLPAQIRWADLAPAGGWNGGLGSGGEMGS